MDRQIRADPRRAGLPGDIDGVFLSRFVLRELKLEAEVFAQALKQVGLGAGLG